MWQTLEDTQNLKKFHSSYHFSEVKYEKNNWNFCKGTVVFFFPLNTEGVLLSLRGGLNVLPALK